MKSPAQLAPAAEWLLTAALIAAFIVTGFLPAWRTMNTDFPNYFVAAAIHQQGVPLDRAYEWRWFQRHKDHLEIDQPIVGFAPHPPMVAVPILPLTLLPSLAAKRVWLIANLGFLLLALCILRRVTQLPWRRLLLLAFLCIFPLRQNFLYGQYYLLILLLICWAYFEARRARHFTSGAVLAAAASLKIFPAFFLILFLYKKNGRAAAGLVTGGTLLAAVSVLIFGWDVHRIYLLEVLPRALHGDLVGPYTLQWNSFTALWHRFFLSEPEMNPLPWLNSPLLYSLAAATTATLLLFSFLFSTKKQPTETREGNPRTTAWEWATFLPLLLLLSSMPTAYHHCVLIFTVIVAFDLLFAHHSVAAFAVVFLYAVASYPLPGFAWLNLQARLFAVLALYILLLCKAACSANVPLHRTRLLPAALAICFLIALTLSNLRSLRNRAEDFPRRLPPITAGYATFSISSAGDHLLANEMVADGFAAVDVALGATLPMPERGDILAIASSPQSPYVYFELTNRRSKIFRLPVSELGQPTATPTYVTDGRDPAISYDGRWLAFLRGDPSKGDADKTEVWLSEDGGPPLLVPASKNLAGVLEMSVTSVGSVIVSAASPADPYLTMLLPDSPMPIFFTRTREPIRYPAISPDGQRLAFTRRESGSWHLIVQDLKGTHEQRLTTAACNASAPAWENNHSLLYITDCARGLGLGAPARVSVEVEKQALPELHPDVIP